MFVGEFMKGRENSFYNKVVKRVIDIICSFMAIVFLSIKIPYNEG